MRSTAPQPDLLPAVRELAQRVDALELLAGRLSGQLADVAATLAAIQAQPGPDFLAPNTASLP